SLCLAGNVERGQNKVELIMAGLVIFQSHFSSRKSHRQAFFLFLNFSEPALTVVIQPGSNQVKMLAVQKLRALS
ncbi:MAG: hypothetical protein ACYSTG_10800, partial [Planctomycetota bacterium]